MYAKRRGNFKAWTFSQLLKRVDQSRCICYKLVLNITSSTPAKKLSLLREWTNKLASFKTNLDHKMFLYTLKMT